MSYNNRKDNFKLKFSIDNEPIIKCNMSTIDELDDIFKTIKHKIKGRN